MTSDAITERICILLADGIEPADILAKCFHACPYEDDPYHWYDCVKVKPCPRLKERGLNNPCNLDE